jgi:hypothetical protein
MKALPRPLPRAALLVAWSVVFGPVVAGCASSLPEVEAGSHVLAGAVTDVEGRALPWASVVLFGTPRGAVANENGEFLIERLRPGRCDLTVLYLGYRSDPAPVRIPVAEDTTYTLSMSEDPRLGRTGP